ncbi:exo-beta-N-acetylmuramidase NamZ domain-containing protein [Flavihumibacter solisilvae]|uniref:exo-beta-N-acetylmuramidase NamZ family protein n=1 Tax=Flavihumibacter solisilvae TaxID=1349421 RepID=UPI0009E5F656|nr:DUF1343 domain-containing protein [Flavihumibacter solisilvae]
MENATGLQKQKTYDEVEGTGDCSISVIHYLMIRKNGIDVLLEEGGYGELKALRWGLVTNNAAFTRSGVPARKVLVEKDWNIVKLFSPEHGICAQAEDGQRQGNVVDLLTGLPVESLYGDSFAPADRSMEDLDGILFDIPDSGCRFYTFLWTMTHVMESCAKWDKQFVVLDRFNPIGRQLPLAEGPLLDEQHCSSFIGRWSIPIRHCCTLGELAGYFRGTRLPALRLTVARCDSPPLLPETDPAKLRWTAPSPSLPDPMNALLYPGMGLLEGLNVNEGRGTSLPFRVFGAPYLNSYDLAANINELRLPGLTALPFSYVPAWGTYEKMWCHGIQWQVYEPAACRPVNSMIAVARLMDSMYPQKLAQRAYPTHANPPGSNHLDRLLGIANAFQEIRNGDLARFLTVGDKWKEMILPYRLYPES